MAKQTAVSTAEGNRVVKGFKNYRFETDDRTTLADDYGFRTRRTKATRAQSSNTEYVFEMAGSYYYSNQQQVTQYVRSLAGYLTNHHPDLEVTAGYPETYRIPDWKEQPTKDDVEFNFAEWPKTSWAVIWVRITRKA